MCVEAASAGGSTELTSAQQEQADELGISAEEYQKLLEEHDDNGDGLLNEGEITAEDLTAAGFSETEAEEILGKLEQAEEPEAA